MSTDFTRRDFIRTTGSTGLGIAAFGLPALGSVPANSKLNVLSIGVIGSIGGTDRKQIAGHPAVQITGLCDVDAKQRGRHQAKQTQRRIAPADVCRVLEARAVTAFTGRVAKRRAGVGDDDPLGRVREARVKVAVKCVGLGGGADLC